MTDLTRTISISSLVFLSLFCFQAGIFLCSGHKLRQNGRRTLVFIEFFTGFMLLFDALAYFYRGNTSAAGYYMVRASNFFVFVCNFSISFFFCFYVCEFIMQARLNFSILLKPKSSVKNGIPIQLFIVLFFCFVGIAFTVVSQFTDFFYYFDKNNIYHLLRGSGRRGLRRIRWRGGLRDRCGGGERGGGRKRLQAQKRRKEREQQGQISQENGLFHRDASVLA